MPGDVLGIEILLDVLPVGGDGYYHLYLFFSCVIEDVLFYKKGYENVVFPFLFNKNALV